MSTDKEKTPDITRIANVDAWFTKEIQAIPAATRELLEGYSKVPSDQVLSHVQEQRDKAFRVFPYPCIGQLRFLNLALSGHPLYPNILERLQQGQKILDVGCCFGQDMRELVADGAPSKNVYGMDIEGKFFDLGYDLFRDRNTLRSTFLAGDILDPRVDWTAIDGKMDILNLSSFLHLFNWENQVRATRRLIQFLRPQPGSLIVRRHLGSLTAKEHPTLANDGSTNFRQNVESYERMWKQLGDETGTAWRVEASLDMVDITASVRSQKWSESEMRRLLFTVTRE